MDSNLSEMSEDELRDSHGVSVYGHSGGTILVEAAGEGDAEDSPSASSHGVVVGQTAAAAAAALAATATPVNLVHTHGAGEVFSSGVLTAARPSAVSRVVVVTSHGALSASSHTLTLHRIHVKEEQLQTAAEDLSVSSANDSTNTTLRIEQEDIQHHHHQSNPQQQQHHHHHHPQHHQQHHHQHHHHHNPEEDDHDELDEDSPKTATTTDGETTLTVIVPGNEDSSEAQLLSPKLSPSSGISVSVASMIDASEFRGLQTEHGYQALSSVNGRLSPAGFSPSQASSQYATLTPLQPLPPISTMSDKFAYGHAGNVAGSFTVMHNNGLGNLGLGVSSPYTYEKLSAMGMSPPHYSSPTNGLGLGLSHQPSPSISPHHYTQNGLGSPPKVLSPNGYDSYGNGGNNNGNGQSGPSSNGSGGSGNNGGNSGGGSGNSNGGSNGNGGDSTPTGARDLRSVTLHHGSQSHSPSLSPPGSANVQHSSPPHHGMGFGVATGVALTSSMPTVNGLAILSPHSSSPDNSPPMAGATAVVVTHRNVSSPPNASSSPLPMTSVMAATPLVAATTGLPAGASLTTQAVITAHSQHSHAHSHPHISHTGNVVTTTAASQHVTHVLNNSGSLAIKTSSTSGAGGGGNSGGNSGNSGTTVSVGSGGGGGNSGNSSVNLTSTPAGSGNSGGSSTISGSGGELEEINTKELAARISAELKRYSIPQAIFAQRVLCRSQGTLSDLLRNPKPWSKLKSGRETFRRMWKWLQEPEFQRMSALRLAGKSLYSYIPNSTSVHPSPLVPHPLTFLP